jgi:imidazolonepropionase-like amidohydrolase
VARFGIPTLAGPYLFSALLFTLAIVLLLVFLRPDPAVVARIELGRTTTTRTDAPRAGMRAALRFVMAHRAALLGVSAMAVGNVVMIGVMAMTPVHIKSAGHDAAHTLGIVGIVLSFHIAGMYAFSPVFGWLTDRVGRRPVIFSGVALLLAACAIAGTARHDTTQLAAGLMVLGLGWSATMVAGSTLLSESIPVELRASAQGLSDVMMGLAGASAGALSGVVVASWGYPTLTLLAALATGPLLVLMALSRKPAIAAAALVIATVGCAQKEADAVVALVGARVYRSPEAAPLDNGVILIANGVIAEVGTRTSVTIPAGARVVDCSGAAIVAGFWNSHVHFTEPHWAGADTLPAAGLTARLRTMLTRYGFVRVLDTGSWLENTLALRRRIDNGDVRGPAIRTTGSGFVPPHASPFYILPDRLPELGSPEDAKTQVAERIQGGADAIKLFTGSYAAPTRIVPMPVAIVQAATLEAHRQRRLVVAHPSNDSGLAAALGGGVDVLAHTTPDGGPWDAELVRKLTGARMALIPTLKLWTFELSRRGVDSSTVQRLLNVAVEQLRAFVRGGGDVLFGTDVGYMTDYDPTDEYRYMERAGMSFRQILAALTTVPARRFGEHERTGRLERGMDADLVILDGDPAKDIRALGRVRAVWQQGRLLAEANR